MLSRSKLSALAGCALLLCGSQWVSASVSSIQYYTATIDTSSLAGLSGDVEFQLYLTSVPERDRDNALVYNITTDATYTPGPTDGEVVDDLQQNGQLLQGAQNQPGVADNLESEYHMNVSSFGDTLSFSLRLEGNELEGQLPDAFGFAGFDALIDANYPDTSHGGFDSEQVLFDDDFDTVGVSVDDSGNLVTDADPAASIIPQQSVPVPEPASILLIAGGLTLTLYRRRRS